MRFNPRAPCGARLISQFFEGVGVMFQSTRPVRGATMGVVFRRTAPWVSIHAPRAGRDANHTALSSLLRVSIHAPRAGRDNHGRHCKAFNQWFQSTRPVRGATWVRPRPCFLIGCFNPRAPCGARPGGHFHAAVPSDSFNPRAPCGARRIVLQVVSGSIDCFNPRAPCGARLDKVCRDARAGYVSIHAPRAGRDFPWGVADKRGCSFQSTRPVRGAT